MTDKSDNPPIDWEARWKKDMAPWGLEKKPAPWWEERYWALLDSFKPDRDRMTKAFQLEAMNEYLQEENKVLKEELVRIFYPCKYDELVKMPIHSCQCGNEDSCFGGSSTEICKLKKRNDEMSETTAEEEETAEVIPFEQPTLSLITGGKDGSNTNWLAKLKEGAIFHSRNKKEKSPLVEQWHVQIKYSNISVLLHSNFPQPQEVNILVDSRVWSQQNELVEVIVADKQELQYE